MRLSVTTVEAYRLFRTEEWMTWERFRNQVIGEYEPTEDMQRGTAFHSILEYPGHYRDEASGNYICDGFEMDGASIDRFLCWMPPGLPEVKTELEMCGHTVVGKCDLLAGLEVHDFKCPKQIKPDGYHASYQWRLYLEIFGCDLFVYDVCDLRPVKRGSNVYHIWDWHPYKLYRYPSIREDCERIVAECGEFLSKQELVA